MSICVCVCVRVEESCFTNGHVESAGFEFTILLAQGTFLTAAMNQAIPTRALLQRVLSPHFGAIEARVQTPTSSKTDN
jgi:hypothetical protein